MFLLNKIVFLINIVYIYKYANKMFFNITVLINIVYICKLKTCVFIYLFIYPPISFKKEMVEAAAFDPTVSQL
jgi:hypothetical protein